MTARRWRRLATTVTAIVALGAVTVSVGPGVRPGLTDASAIQAANDGSDACPWLDSRLPVASRVSLLLRAMSPRQEATMLQLFSVNPDVPYEGYTPAIPALCIPQITEQDGAAGVASGFLGVAGFPGVTQLPAPIADAAAFDPGLALRFGDVIGAEDATKGIGLALSPTINIDRSPLWGRSYETLGEDPYLTASLAVPLVKGIQGNRVVSVLKHFAVYNQELNRATVLDNSIVSDRALHEIYLPAFAAAVKSAQAGAVMCSYNLINGVPACEDAALLDGILRQDWHFNGFVRSDCGSVYNQAPAMAVGVSQVKCTHLYDPDALAAAVTEGRMPRATLDALAGPLLGVLFRYDLIADPHPLTPDAVASTAAHRGVALRTNEEGSVLLKNDRSLLPLNLSRLPSLALIGPGGGTPMPAGFGAMHVEPSNPVNARAALGAALGSRLRYDDGADIGVAAALAKRSAVAVVVVHDVQAERRDRTSLALPGNQDALVAAVAAANPRTVVVLETGSAVLMPWSASVPAVLETWYPGETAGPALVDLLSGRANPSGKLPVSFPTSAAAMPDNTASTFGGTGGQVHYADDINVGYRWYQANQVQPAFGFGYGLSYTRFHFSGLRVTTTPAGGLNVQATITNVGPVRGADVVQCYLGHPAGSGEPPLQLRGYTRVDLAPRQSTTVQLNLSAGDLATWNTGGHGWVVAGGGYRVSVGDGSNPANLPLTTTVEVKPRTVAVDAGPAGS